MKKVILSVVIMVNSIGHAQDIKKDTSLSVTMRTFKENINSLQTTVQRYWQCIPNKCSAVDTQSLWENIKQRKKQIMVLGIGILLVVSGITYKKITGTSYARHMLLRYGGTAGDWQKNHLFLEATYANKWPYNHFKVVELPVLAAGAELHLGDNYYFKALDTNTPQQNIQGALDQIARFVTSHFDVKKIGQPAQYYDVDKLTDSTHSGLLDALKQQIERYRK